MTPQLCGAISSITQSIKSLLLPHAQLILFLPGTKEKGSSSFHGFFMVKIKKPYIRFYFHHNNHGEEPAGIYGENTTYIIYITFSPCMVNVVYTIHRENKRNRKKIGKKEPCSTQKAFAFVEYGTRRYPSSSDRPVAVNKSYISHGRTFPTILGL